MLIVLIMFKIISFNNKEETLDNGPIIVFILYFKLLLYTFIHIFVIDEDYFLIEFINSKSHKMVLLTTIYSFRIDSKIGVQLKEPSKSGNSSEKII